MPEKAPPTPPPVAPGARDKEPAPRDVAVNGPQKRAPITESRTAPEPDAPGQQVEADKPENGHLHQEVPAHPGVPLAPPGIVPESDVRTHSPAAAVPPKEHGLVEELGELPMGYGDGRLVALIRDPQTVYVYWDLSQQQIEQAFGGLGTARASLKLFNTRGNGMLRDVEVHLEARGWYVRELPSALELRVELWAQGDRGARLLRAARPIRLPPMQPSDVHDEFYATLPPGTALRGEPVSGGRPLAWKAGGAPAGWERRMQPRYSTTSPTANRIPWSGTLQKPDGDEQ